MIESADIQEAAVALWATSVGAGGLTVTIPGGLRFGRVPETGSGATPVASPYASLTVKEQAPLRTGLPKYLQAFIVEFRIYSDVAGEPTGELARTLDNLFDFLPRTFTLTNGQSLYVLHSNRKEGELKQDDTRLKATDVLVATGRYEWLCQGTAPV